MRPALVLALVGFAGLATPPAAAEPQAPAPKIELYTMGPGEPIPERFGHSALCVRYPDGGAPGGGPAPRDRCYDYGIFDASEPLTLGYRFLRGESVFWVGERRPDAMIRAYERRDRDMWRQTLPLSDDAARRAAADLERDALPENRYYHYHHYFDNCSTRVRDIIDDASGGALSDLPDGAIRGADGEGRTLRDFTHEGFAEHAGLLVGSDLVLGRSVDERPDVYEVMFLPIMLRDGVEAAFGVEPELIYARRAPPLSDDPGLGAAPLFAGAGAALFVAIVAAALYRRFERGIIALAALPLALIGLVLWTIAIVSPLPEVRYNELFLVFMPLDAALPFLSRERRYYYAAARLAMIGLAIALSFVGLFAQPMAPALVALLPMAAVLWQTSRLRERWTLAASPERRLRRR